MSELWIEDRKPILGIAPVVLRLLQGTLYSEENRLWALLGENLNPVREYFNQIGLELHIHKDDGMAYLTQLSEDEDPLGLPRLIRRQPLSFEATLLAVLLREALDEFDLSNPDSRDLVLTVKEIRTRLMPFLGERYDETRLIRQFDRYLGSLEKLGFLREVPRPGLPDPDSRQYQVMRILKAKINNEKLEEIRQKLEDYVKAI